jgi:hypothetical protein
LRFSRLAACWDELEDISGRHEMIARLASLLAELGPDEVEPVVYLGQGRLAPFFEPLEIGLGERSVAEAIARLRELDLVKPPGAAEAIDWAQALALLGAETVDGDRARETLGWAVKNREDLRRAEEALVSLGR